MVATIERSTSTQITRRANCVACLTRNCPMNGQADSPVTLCNTFREANCAFCSTTACSMNGAINSPVMVCDSFDFLQAN